MQWTKLSQINLRNCLSQSWDRLSITTCCYFCGGDITNHENSVLLLWREYREPDRSLLCDWWRAQLFSTYFSYLDHLVCRRTYCIKPIYCWPCGKLDCIMWWNVDLRKRVCRSHKKKTVLPGISFPRDVSVWRWIRQRPMFLVESGLMEIERFSVHSLPSTSGLSALFSPAWRSATQQLPTARVRYPSFLYLPHSCAFKVVIL